MQLLHNGVNLSIVRSEATTGLVHGANALSAARDHGFTAGPICMLKGSTRSDQRLDLDFFANFAQALQWYICAGEAVDEPLAVTEYRVRTLSDVPSCS